MNFMKDKDGYVCPYNNMCRCWDLECYRCGWNPKVAKVRVEAVRKKLLEGDNHE